MQESNENNSPLPKQIQNEQAKLEAKMNAKLALAKIKEASINNSYVYTWPGYGKFIKEVISREEICSKNALAKINQAKIHFKLHDPIEH